MGHKQSKHIDWPIRPQKQQQQLSNNSNKKKKRKLFVDDTLKDQQNTLASSSSNIKSRGEVSNGQMVKIFSLMLLILLSMLLLLFLTDPAMGNAGYTCIRRTFCWLNIILWLCSCAFLGAGLWLRLSYEGYATLLPQHAALSADTIFMGIGGTGFVVSFFGCCGAWAQSRCLLVLYFMLIVMLFMSEFLVGSIAFLFRGGLGRTLANELRFGIERHYNVSDRGSLVAPSVSAIWDSVQQSFECCGVSSYEDWYDIQTWPGKRWVPESCCRTLYDQRQVLTEGSGDGLLRADCGRSENPSLWWDKGCAHSLQSWFTGQLNVVGAVGLGIAFVQLFGLITSMLLFCTVKHKRASDTYKSYSPSIDPQTRTSSWED